jgi:transposase InsO family protein
MQPLPSPAKGCRQRPPSPSRARSDCPERAFPPPIDSSHRKRPSARRSERPHSRVPRGRRMMKPLFRPLQVKTPIRAPKANAFAERWVRTARGEWLDHLLILGRNHLEGVLWEFVGHYNAQRPHRGLRLAPPPPPISSSPVSSSSVRRRDRLGGLIHEYHREAA